MSVKVKKDGKVNDDVIKKKNNEEIKKKNEKK